MCEPSMHTRFILSYIIPTYTHEIGLDTQYNVDTPNHTLLEDTSGLNARRMCVCHLRKFMCSMEIEFVFDGI